MKLQINIASTDYRKIDLAKWIMYGVSLLSGLLLSFNLLNYSAARNELKEAAEMKNRIRNQEMRFEDDLKKEGLVFSANEASEINKRITLINNLLIKKGFHWTLFLSQLEAVVPRNISVSSIRPHFADGNIDLDGEALSLKDLTDFIISLEKSQGFKNVFLTNQKFEKKENEGILFSLKVKYQPQL